MTSPDTRRRRVLGGALAAPLAATALPTLAADESRQPGLALPGLATRLRIGFGSCAHQRKPQPIWQAVAAARPDLFLFMGDNLYADAKTADELRQRYQEFMAVEPLQDFRRRIPHLAVWDDHDFGDDDVGGDYPHKILSQQLFCDAWNEPADSPRRSRDGVYESWILPVGKKRVQILFTDLRFNRTPLTPDPERKGSYTALVLKSRLTGQTMKGWYRPNPAPEATQLGERQWRWLEQQLRQPADVRVLASSLQFAATGTGWEGWDLFPAERERFCALLRTTGAEGLVVLSGDMHYGEISRWQPEGGYPLWDATSSGLTEVWDVPTPNGNRVSGVYAAENFGLLDIDFGAARPELRFDICDQKGKVRLSQSVPLDTLRFKI
jgi:alkaline phosphatase D